MSDSAELPPGTELGAYRIVRCIGMGGMGAVYEAEHRELRKRVAIKTPFTEAGLSPEGRARFVQEGKTASKLRHPHVVDITDVGEVDDVAFLVMELLQGEPFAARIVREAPLPAHVIADTLIPVAAALDEAHGMGIVHRDLKPDNIFLTRSVQGGIHPKILDFGISKVLGDDLSPRLTSTSNVMLGTPNYVSPEQLETPHAITARSDQYSLGVVIYEAATGNNPFAGHRSLMSILRAIGKGDYPQPRDLNAQIDERLERVALRAMSVSPGARYPSMAALAAELMPLASPETRNTWARYFAPGSDYATVASSAPRSIPRAQRRRWPSWALAAVALGALGAGATVFLAAGRGEPLAVPVRAHPVQPAPKAPNVQARPVAGTLRVASEAPSDRAEPAAVPGLLGQVSSAAASRRLTVISNAEPSNAELSNTELSNTERSNADVARSQAAASRAEPARGRRSKVQSPREPRASRSARSNDEVAERAGAARGEPDPPPEKTRAERLPARSVDTLRTDNVDPWDTRDLSP